MSLRLAFPHLPLSPELRRFMDLQPEFCASLKLANPTRFEVFRGFILSSTPPGTPRCTDQVIGVWYLDKHLLRTNETPLFKQDFIVNVGAAGATFFSYAKGFPTSKYVRPIDDFFRDYGSGGAYYHKNTGKSWQHHYDDVADLPDYVRAEGAELKQAFSRVGLHVNEGAT